MSYRFKKNNCISDSESDEESAGSRTSSSDSSTDDLSPIQKNNSSANQSDTSSVTNKSNSFEESYQTVPPSDDENSFNSPKSVASNSREHSKKNTKSGEKRVSKDHNANQFLKGKSGVLRQSVVENSIDCELGEVLALESSTSVVNESESIIDDSCNETCNNLGKTPGRNKDIAKSRIIEESSDSDISVQCVDSPERHSANSSKNKKINSSDEIEILESSVQVNNSVGSLSKTLSQGNNSQSLSGISDVSQSSVQSISNVDERRALEQKLMDKRTAYQNILRAVKSCNPNKLKDGGKLLQEKLAKCKEEVDELKEKLKSMVDASGDDFGEKYSAKSNVLFSTSDQVTSNLGRKGLETHRVQAALTVDALVTLHGSLQTCPAEDELEEDPKGLRSKLMPHQKYALAWLLWREKQTPPGGILADDMGLGKTLTMIGLVLRSEEYKRQNNVEEEMQTFMVNNVRMYTGKTLVVCPSSLLGQWEGQIKQHCKAHLLSTLIHHGKPRELQAKKLAAHDIVITSYGVIVEENKIIKGDKKGALFRVKWERVIIDEGHVIRNHKTKTAQALCELEAKYRWCLTGTPVQNKELDMYSLLKFLRCTPFDNLAVWKRWVDNKSANGVQRLNTVVKSILLRRTKEELQSCGELQELPGKTSVPVYIKLDEEEQKVYHTVLHFSKTLLAEYILQEQKKVGFVSDELKSEHRNLLNSANEIKTTEIFVLLLRLRQICCLPGLIHAMLEKESCAEDGIDAEDDPILQDLTSQMKRMSVGAPSHVADDLEKKKKILLDSNPVFQIDRASMKIRTVLGIINEALEADDKIIIVSQWANLLHKLKNHITPLNIGVVMLDGSVPVKFRPRIIDEFNSSKSDVKVMLLSLTAGGVGLNLMGGNRLIIFEPHWNPQLESQACDRIYRVGQKKPVYIYKIICKNTIEEKIELLQKKKLELANTVLKGELKMNRSKLTLADLKILFDIH